TVTQDGPVWAGSRLDQPNTISRYRRGSAEDVITVTQAGSYVPVENHWFTSFDGRQVQGWL
ncbi:MAG: hypothetical protein KC418_06245, partial [Anaerolineales bacterium]|nr:hypothetical protein [Anaerolineales bacterium]